MGPPSRETREGLGRPFRQPWEGLKRLLTQHRQKIMKFERGSDSRGSKEVKHSERGVRCLRSRQASHLLMVTMGEPQGL